MINVNSEYYPTLSEAVKAKETVEIIEKQPIIFNRREFHHVLLEIQCRHRDLFKDGKNQFLMWDLIYNYGYISGKRAERKKRRKQNT